MGATDLAQLVRELNTQLGIPNRVKDAGIDEAAYLSSLQEMAETSLHDGCTKTNPVIPTVPEFADLLKKAYYGA